MKNKTGVFFSSNFRDMGKVMPVVFGVCRSGYEKGQLAFSKRIPLN